jgi:hypothetical protein
MASLQEGNGSYRMLFCYPGKLHTFTVGKLKQEEQGRPSRLPADAPQTTADRVARGPRHPHLRRARRKPPDIGPMLAKSSRVADEKLPFMTIAEKERQVAARSAARAFRAPRPPSGRHAQMSPAWLTALKTALASLRLVVLPL